MHSLIFIPFEIFQILASLQLTKQIFVRRSIYAISLDFTLYSWVWAFTHTVANGLYSFSTTVQNQYAARYPLYPGIQYSEMLVLLNLLQLCLCTVLAKKCFFVLKSQEHLSIVCKIILGSCLAVFLWLLWLFCNGRATINLLDLADCLLNIGSIALACRLIPQISLNWFLDCFPLSEPFLLLHYLAVSYASTVLLLSYNSGSYWYDLPIGSPSQVVLGTTWCALAGLTYQRRHYGTKTIHSNNIV